MVLLVRLQPWQCHFLERMQAPDRRRRCKACIPVTLAGRRTVAPSFVSTFKLQKPASLAGRCSAAHMAPSHCRAYRREPPTTTASLASGYLPQTRRPRAAGHSAGRETDTSIGMGVK